MVRKQPEIRRQELLQIATRQFISQGYDKTSIRSIVGEVGGEIGMFSPAISVNLIIWINSIRNI